MALLEKLNFKSGEQNKDYEDVPVPEIEDGAEIRICKVRVKAQLRIGHLQKKILEMKGLDADTVMLYRNTATLMCVMVDDRSAPLVPGDDIESTFNYLDQKGVFFRLVEANNRVNGVKVVQGENLEDSKKNS